MAGAVLLDFAISPLFIWDTFSTALAEAVGVSPATASVGYAAGLAGFTCGVLAGGRAADRIAPRRLAVVVGVGTGLGLGLTAVATTLPLLVLGFGILVGGASGLGYATAVRVAGTAVRRRGGAVAIVVASYAAGAVLLAPLASAMLTAWGATRMLLTLAVGLGLLVFAAAALLPGAGLPERHSAARQAHIGRDELAPVPALWMMFALGSLPALVAFGHAAAFAGHPGWGVAAVSLLNAGNFAGRILAGPAVDRLGQRPALHASAAAAIAACLALAAFQHPAATLPSLLVLGMQYGALSVLTPLATVAAVSPQRFGTAYGIVFSGWGLVGLTAPVAAAWLASQYSYSLVAALLAGVALLSWIAGTRATRVTGR
ncbi:MFS transporter [Allosalinactinospora lopnorensis]|uniref:MFS transporter n=1 Tax=Allosalinactinospora lopnorensis TaxID=1352348 RepID=UPI000623ECEC|nr:MFS transporter [Allosalinactinospora lopnorensis]